MSNGEPKPDGIRRIVINQGVVFAVGLATIVMIAIALVSRNADLAIIKNAIGEAANERKQIESEMRQLLGRYGDVAVEVERLKHAVKDLQETKK